MDYLVDAGVHGLCRLATYSEQFSLTDAERDAIARTLLEHVAGRLPVIVTTSHFSAGSPPRAAARRRHGRGDGDAHAAVLRRYAHRAGPAVIEYFKQVADAIDIPVMVQDAPLSATPLPASLLIDLVGQVPQVQYAKIEVPQAVDKLHALVSALGAAAGSLPPRRSATLIPDLDAGTNAPCRARWSRRARRRSSAATAGHGPVPSAPGKHRCRSSIREPPVRPSRAEHPAGRGRHHRLRPHARPSRGVARTRRGRSNWPQRATSWSCAGHANRIPLPGRELWSTSDRSRRGAPVSRWVLEQCR